MARKKYSDKTCCLCKGKIDIIFAPDGTPAWELGHNAPPLMEGQCCSFCNDTKVLPARFSRVQSNKVH